MTTATCTKLPAQDIPWVLGAGGFNIFRHLGVLKAAEEMGVSIGTVLGVSAGALTAAFITNGYKPDELSEILLKLLQARYEPGTYVAGTRPADPLSLSIGGWFSLEPFIADLVKQYDLKPNRRLRILACDILSHDPVIFEGTDYNLAHALAAASSVPSVFQPVWDFSGGRPRLLVDGAVYHFNPTEFTQGPAIVSTFVPSTKPPVEGLPIDYWFYWYFHIREAFFPVVGNRRYVDPCRNLVIETGSADEPNNALNFGISPETCHALVEDGYATARKDFARAFEDGRLSRGEE